MMLSLSRVRTLVMAGTLAAAGLWPVPASAAQGPCLVPLTGPRTMAQVAALINTCYSAILSTHSGTSAPANNPSGTISSYQWWFDTTSNPSLLKVYNGSQSVTVGALNTSTHTWVPYLTGGVSGGIPYFSGAGPMASSALLANHGLVVGGGAATAPRTITTGTDGQLPIGQTGADPAMTSATGDVTITAAGVTAVGPNKITSAMLRQGAARSVVGVTGNATANVADIQGATDQVLRINGAGTAAAFGAVDLSKPAAATGVLQAGSFPALSGDVTTVAGVLASTLVNIPDGVPMAGSVLATAITAPGTSASGKSSVYIDSTTKALTNKDDAGTLHTTIIADAGASNNFLTAISAAGVISKAQPSFSDLSGQSTLAQFPNIAANTALVNATSGSAAPTASALPSCSTAGSALIWTTNTGYGCNSAIAAATASALATPRAIYGNNFDGSTALTQIIASTYGGTGNGFTKFTGPATTERTFTLPNADAVLAYHAENLSVFAATTSAQLAGVLSDEVGTGPAVFANAPALVDPTVTTQSPGDNTTKAASTAFVTSAISASGGGTVSSIVCGGLTITSTGVCPETFTTQNCSLAASVAADVLTVAVKDAAGNDPSPTSPCRIPFRNVTAATGSTTFQSVTGALSITTNAVGASLGSVANTAFRFWVVGFDNGGNVVPALFNASTATSCAPINEGVPQSSTAISGSATSAAVYYTPNGTTVSAKAVKILGYVEYNSTGLGTAGTYATAPNFIQTFGPGVWRPCEATPRVYATDTTQVQAGSTTAVQTSLTASVTLSSAANLVRVKAFGDMRNTDTNAVAVAQARISRGTGPTFIGNIASAFAAATGFNGVYASAAMQGWDKPNTTSAQAYVVYIFASHNGGTANHVTWLPSYPGPVGSIEIDEIMG